MKSLPDAARNSVRQVMRVIARGLNTLSGGNLSPNSITIFGLLAHIPVAYCIAQGKLVLAAVLLVVFGLFDTLDGELARLQKRDSSIGMLLDSATDRMKEIILYAGIGYFLVAHNQAFYAVWAVLALGGSVLTSYVNAWGEVVLAKSHITTNLNKTFRGGFLSFEVRMFLMAVALVVNRLSIFVVFVAVFAWFTANQRLVRVINRLR